MRQYAPMRLRPSSLQRRAMRCVKPRDAGFIQRSTTTASCAGSIHVRCPPAPTMQALPVDAPGKLRPSRLSQSSRP